MPRGTYPHNYANGGAYWMSESTMRVIADAPFTGDWAEDRWVGNTLAKHGIKPTPLHGYELVLWKSLDECKKDRPIVLSNVPDGSMWRERPIKVLIAINSWAKGATNGDNQAMRDTFLKDVAKYPGLEYRFFIGDGTPTGEDETALMESARALWDEWHRHGTPPANKAPDFKCEPPTFTPKSDEIALHVPDDYWHVSYKTREGHRWGIEHGFDFIFTCYPDTYIDIDRLMASGFENYDYVGKRLVNGRTYAKGGQGYMLSKNATLGIIDEPVTDSAEDRWVGYTVTRKGIVPHWDDNYADYPLFPQSGNSVITSHLADGANSRYDSGLMRALYAKRTLVQTKAKPVHAKIGYCSKHIMLGCMECS